MDGKPIDLKELNGRAIFNVLCSFLLGKRFEYSDAYFKKFLKTFDDTVSWMVSYGHFSR